MTNIEQKRFDYLSEKHAGDERYSAEKIEFLVRTGLTFEPTDDNHSDWHYPKGAGFVTESDKEKPQNGSKDPDTEATNGVNNKIRNASKVTVEETDEENGEDMTKDLDKDENVNVLTGSDDSDDDDLNPDPLTDADDKILTTADKD